MTIPEFKALVDSTITDKTAYHSVTPNDVGTAFDELADIVEANSGGGTLTPDQIAAIDGAAAPSASNVFATIDDIVSSGGGDMVLASTQTVSGLKTFLSGMFGLRNIANTFTSFFTNTNTASRTYTLQDRNGTLADDTDLALKANKVTITGATKTKITYNAQGIVTGGADSTTADIADSTNKRYVTDANLATIGSIVVAAKFVLNVGAGDVGSHYTISNAIESILVVRNNLIDSDNTFSSGVWTFAEPLIEGEKLIFIYNKTI